MNEEILITTEDIYYPITIAGIKKSKDHLQPVFEAFTNSLEAIKLLNSSCSGEIKIELFLDRGTTDDTFIFDKIIIEDNGIGFDDKNFHRLKMFKDTRKGFSNNGTGRFQLLHFFNTSHYESIFKEGDLFKQRNFTLSKRFASQNAIISLSMPDSQVIDTDKTKTILTLEGLLDKKDDEKFYEKLTASELKKKLISRYVMEFCLHRNNLPEILISEYIGEKWDHTVSITQEDIPQADKEKEQKIILNYSRLSENGKNLERSERREEFLLTPFVIPEENLDENSIKLTSKGEIALNPKIELTHLAPKDTLDKKRYLFLLSGDYLNQKDGDERGNLSISTRKDFINVNSDVQDMLDKEEILLEDIEEKTNAAVLVLYDEIKEKTNAKKQDIEKLKSMFLLSQTTVDAISESIASDDSEEKILEKFYVADVKIAAKKDAAIKKRIDELDKLDPASKNYRQKINSLAAVLVKEIPMQNRAELVHYVARRKLVLDLFQKILDHELDLQKKPGRNKDEKLLHNLIFQQSADNPEESDLWLINEDFIYFAGHSEKRLADIKIDDKKLFRDSFSALEEEYLKSGGGDRLKKRPDVLLFPEEGKCIIIEFKNPTEDVSNHLAQINKYASWIQNYSTDEFSITTFYGYLIGENIQREDVQGADSYFQEAYHFDYLFCPYMPIRDNHGNPRGSLYREVIKYRTLLERAKKRNQIFIDKLTKSGNVKKDADDSTSQQLTEAGN